MITYLILRALVIGMVWMLIGIPWLVMKLIFLGVEAVLASKTARRGQDR